MKFLYSLFILSLILIGIERFTLPPTTNDMIASALRYGEENHKEIPPKTFHQDSCTLLPNTFLGSDFREPCLHHDIIYWYGGTGEERKVADQTLRKEVGDTGFFGFLLQYPIYFGVRLFGDTWLTKLFDANWGYGWNE